MAAPSLQYRVGDVSIVRFSEDRYALHNLASGAVRGISYRVAQFIAGSSTFETREDALTRITASEKIIPGAKLSWSRSILARLQACSPEQASAFGTELDRLAEEDFVITDRRISESCHSSAQNEGSRGHISRLGIITHNRPESFQRCLSSFIDHIKLWDKPVDLITVDDSETDDVRQRYLQILRENARRYGKPLLYLGRNEKQELIRRLDSKGLNPDVATFCLFGDARCGTPSPGRNRNAYLLACVGTLCLSVDDDTEHRMSQHPETRSGMGIVENDPTEFWFFPDQQRALNFSPKSEVDLFAAHEAVLGRKLGAVMNDLSPRIELGGESRWAEFVGELLRDRATAIGTCTGVLGDSGMSSPVRLLLRSDPGTHRRLTESRASFVTAMSSRQVLRGAPCYSAVQGQPLLGACLGLDQRDLLPPFLPVGRNEEWIFGALVGKLFKNAYFVHLPWVLLHLGSSSSCYNSANSDYVSRLRLSDVIRLCIDKFNPNSPITDRRKLIHKMGDYFCELASLERVELYTWLHAQALHQLHHEIDFCEKLLKRSAGGPKYWQCMLRQVIENRCAAAIISDYARPVDIKMHDLDPAVDVTQRVLASYGQLLQWWPDIVCETQQAIDCCVERIS